MKKIILMAWFLAVGSIAHGSGLDALKNFNQSVNSLSGSFSQTVMSKNKNKKTSGTFAILRPNLFKWDYNKPYLQTIVGDGKTVWLYDVDLAQVTKRPQDKALGDSPAAILASQGALESNYNLSDDGEENGISYVLAKPKKTDGGYEFIRLGFKGNGLTTMQLKDSFGNQTTLTFLQVKTNPKLSNKTFVFTPPKGVDVLSE